MDIVMNAHKGKGRPANMDRFSVDAAAGVRRYHRSLDGYEPTVLADISATA